MSNLIGIKVVVMAKTWLNLNWGAFETPIYGTVIRSENNRVAIKPDKSSIRIWYVKYRLDTSVFDNKDVLQAASYQRGVLETLDQLVSVSPIDDAVQKLEDLTNRVTSLERKLTTLSNSVNNKFDIASSPIDPSKL